MVAAGYCNLPSGLGLCSSFSRLQAKDMRVSEGQGPEQPEKVPPKWLLKEVALDNLKSQYEDPQNGAQKR